MMELLADLPQEETMGSRNWDVAQGDRAYLSHHHSVEVIDELALQHGLFEIKTLHTIAENEYRNSFIAMETGKEFSVSTIVYPDSSTYTYIHVGGESLGSVTSIDPATARRLSNADIKRPEGRAKRAVEIEMALQELGIIPRPPTEEKKTVKPSGIVIRKGEDGVYVLDYSGFRGGKIESAARVLDYREFSGVWLNDQKPPKNGSGI